MLRFSALRNSAPFLSGPFACEGAVIANRNYRLCKMWRDDWGSMLTNNLNLFSTHYGYNLKNGIDI